ncbi:SoxR reducing system RseC family protein [Methyloversatilis thermotolerans]|uniref:SoxR reducing system RseC family protein n=1 Tax=Methyloversatilis thermotolerans TaxID=1346290 RepID=UPI00036BA00C|nr:SoxR reducing system RseC family protein [Methyloversatilis thermotolerans]
MSERIAQVLGIQGARLTVRTESPEACGSCRSQSACGSGSSAVHRIEVDAGLAARLRAGDHITLNVDDGVPATAALLAYVVPLAGLLLGMGLYGASGGPEAGMLVAGMTGLGSGWWLSRRLSRRWGQALQPQVCGSKRDAD